MKVWEIDPLTFGENLRNMRMDRNMTQKDLADKLHMIGIASVNNWEYGTCLPNLSSILDICQVFGIDEVRIDTTRRWRT